MPSNDKVLHNSRRTRQQPSYVPANPFRRAPDGAAATTTVTTSTAARSSLAATRGAAHDTLPSAKSVRGGPILRNRTVSSPQLPQHASSSSPPLAAVREADNAASVPSGGGGSAAYTGAAILNTYTNRRKMLQKASALSSQMHRQVEDVVQMEEEQRLLSQAYRSRQKLAEQEQEQAQHNSKQKKALAANATPALGSEADRSPEQNALSALDDAEAAAAAGSDNGDAQDNLHASTADGYGVVLEGAPDTKRILQHQAHEKMETLGKMRGMQLAIQELGAEAAAEEERWYARPRFVGEASAETSNMNASAEEQEVGEGATEVSKLRRGVPPDVIGKLDAIRDLRLALKDMLDARRRHAADSGSYGVVGTGASGSTWVEQDAMYTPPAPPQVFSTAALATSLEYASDSMASIARIADEFCIATTFRARNDRLTMLPHLHSLEKWTAQAERSLDTAQRHLRHFHVGETAVVDGGAYEVNSLREQTLMLKETLTAQDQKVKSTAETKAAMEHRLREISRRCCMWETYLLHRNTPGDAEGRLLESTVCDALGDAHSSKSAIMLASMHSGSVIPYTTGSNEYTTTMGSPASMFLVAAVPSTTVSSSHGTRRPTQSSLVERSDASPPPRAPTTILKDFMQLSAPTAPSGTSAAKGSSRGAAYDQPPSPSTMDRMERRIAQSWGNPYVRKRLLRQRAEAAEKVQHEQQQLQASQSSIGLQHHAAVDDTGFIPHSFSPMRANGRGTVDRNGSGGLYSGRPLRHGGPSPTTPNAAVRGSGHQPFPRSPQGESQRRNRVSINSPYGRYPHGTGLVGGDAQQAGHALDASVTASSMATGLGDAERAELADVRTLQLLQSLLRSMPLKSFVHQRASGAPEGVNGPSENFEQSAETSLGMADVLHDEAARLSSIHSVQRLLQFFKSEIKLVSPRAFSVSQT